MKNPKAIQIVKPSATYNIPTFRVEDGEIVDGIGEDIYFCKGSTSDKEIFRQEGVFVESLIKLAAVHLESINVGQLENNDTKQAIIKLEEALMWLGKRAEDRKLREVQGTYAK